MSKEEEDNEEDPTDIFDTSLSSLFSIPPIGFTPDHNGYFTYSPSAQHHAPIKLSIPSPPSSLYTTLQAQLIWPSSIYLADLISQGKVAVGGKNVIELGSAAGLPGVVAYLNGAGKVVSTDYGVREVLEVLEDNFRRAKSPSTSALDDAGEEGERWVVKGHCWGEDVSELLDQINPTSTSPSSDSTPNTQDRPSTKTLTKFDTILAADVLWTTSSHSILLDSITSLMSQDGITHITAGLHTGRGPLERFLLSAKERGLRVDHRGEVRLTGDKDWEKYDESMAREGEEERGVVVWFTLGF
ncbi:hypothetical protein I302_107790 [Kwoniella bestiolae CBS 10118]|uniref:Nicotinamide N-methyltransferase n=1 Tax=Kwoniella bestiolae CBS 10118 TaxID=1296100 RepID=A0A1B9FXI9_9TREE|nr:hypothetical protein I302_06472 [Kwoniella bestiolae CBS 10118]OCF23489.1 hypothetical protein I302_06472 [Kwoniella bestiolae CBS 10118]